MDYQKTLEYDKIKLRLAEHAYSESGKQLCIDLEPALTVSDAEKALAETDQALVMLARYGAPHFGDLKDVTDACARAQSGSVLSVKEIMDVGSTLRVAKGVYDFLETKSDVGVFAPYMELMRPNKYLADKISEAFTGDGEVADNASTALYDIRRKQTQARTKIRNVLDALIHSSSKQKYLQDGIITVRNGRYVVPVKAEYRSEVPGMIHDMSATGATIFVEPMQVVQANNDLSLLEAKEHTEIERILASFSAEIGECKENIVSDFEICRFFDFCFAKARYAQELKATRPILNSNRLISVKAARHPLIPADKVVAVDIILGGSYGALIITGPNTGGKTVTLKTTGLMCLMAKSGLFIPAADGSKVGFFRQIFADIGDEQSIEQSLSTFSAHMSNIVSIIDKADSDSLVLLDELGSGTDPAEGAALAIAIIEHLQSVSVRILATTHYAELKLYALHTENVENASCEFDVATLRPTYRLMIGIPGKSNAFAIASRLGMPEDIITAASKQLSTGTASVESVLADLEIKRKSIETDSLRAEQLKREAAAEAEATVAAAKREAEEYQKEIERKKRKIDDLLEKTQRDSDIMLNRIDELRKEKDRADFRQRIAQTKAEVSDGLKKLETEAEKADVRSRPKTVDRPLKKGETVRIISANKEATVLEDTDSKGYTYVQAGIIKVKVKSDDLAFVTKPAVTVKVSAPTVKLQRGSRNASPEVDVRGMTAYEAEDAVDMYLQNASMAGLHTVNIIHGKGTGALRTAIHQMLRHHKLVDSFRIGLYGEGDSGVTVVNLKE